MTYYLVRFLSYLVCLLPGRFCYWLGRTLALCLWPFLPRRRKKLAIAQVAMCLGTDEKESRRIAKESAVRFGPMFLEVLRFPVILRNIKDYVAIEGAEHLHKVLAQKKGAVIAAAHMGNWELMGGALSQAGFPIIGVAMRQHDAGMDRFINEYRRLVGMHITYQTGVREMFRMIDAGWIIGLISDQDPSLRDGVIVDFFGQPTNAFTGAAAIARRCGVPIFPVFIHREANGHHIVTVDPPIVVEKTDDRAADVLRVTQCINTRIEEWIRTYPEEWFWLHDRWKSLREETNEKGVS